MVFNIIVFWYADMLFDRYFIFGVIPVICSIVMLIIGVIVAIVYISMRKTIKKSCFSLCVFAVTFLIIIFFPFRMAKLKIEFPLYENERLQVVQMVANGEMDVDNIGNAELPKEFNHLSSDGNIFVYQNDTEQVVCFWVFRGMLSGSKELIYCSQGEELIRKNETGHPIIEIEKLKEHWFLVGTDY